MNSDFLMPAQGSSISTMGRTPRPLRTFALAAAGIALSMAVLAPQRLVAPIGSSGSCCSSVRGMAAIIELCRVGRSGDAVHLADTELYRAGSNTALAGELHYLRGGALRLEGREDEAQIDYALAASLSGSDASPESQLDYQAQSGDFQTSSRIAREIINRPSDDTVTINNACWDLTMHPGGDPAMAARAMEPIAKATDHWGYVDTYAWTLFKSGRQQEAIQQEQRALMLVNENRLSGSNMDELYYCAGCLAGFEGNKVEAAQTLRMVFQHNIANTSAWDAAKSFSSAPGATTITNIVTPIVTGPVTQVKWNVVHISCPMDRM